MPGRYEPQIALGSKFGHGSIEISREAGARKHAVQFGNRVRGSGQRTAKHLQTLRQLAQDTYNLRGFLFRKLHKLVVRLHRFEWLEKNGLARSARAMHDPRYATPVLRAHWNHEANRCAA